MIKFFRQIRKSLLSENRFSKYFIYAVGEIVLVMIGILLAFQVNSWQDRRTRAKKELSYLNDIKTNLTDDIATIDKVVDFNKEKLQLADSIFIVFEHYSSPAEYMPKIINYMYHITSYEFFEPNRIAFDNMIGSENIDLVTSIALKKQLSQYYKKEFNSTTQESVKQRSRQFGDYVALNSFNKQSIKRMINHDSDLRDISEVEIHKDPNMYAYLFIMMTTTQSQSEVLTETQHEIRELIKLIDQQIQ